MRPLCSGACCATLSTLLLLASGALDEHPTAATALRRRPSATQRQPCVLLRNAARPGTCMPIMGLGVVGYGCVPGQRSQCWHYGTKSGAPGPCCTAAQCPIVNATRDWLLMGGARVDTGYGYGDDIDGAAQQDVPESKNTGTKAFHDLIGVGIGIVESGIARENIFVTGKAGMSGPMGPYESKQDLQIVKELGLEYIDLLLMHGADTGTPMHDPAHQCMHAKWGKHWGPDAARQCRLVTYKTLVDHYNSGLTRAIGVANWDADDLQELKDEMNKQNNSWIIMPAVAQYRFHPHKSTANPKVAKLIEFCAANNITFNGYSPLGSPDFTTFEPPVGTPSLFAEPAIKGIAASHDKTVAQVILRWHVQQNILTNPRTTNTSHMRENLDVFDWALSESEMQTLSSMAQCSAERGNRYAENCDEVRKAAGLDGIAKYGNETGPTLTC